MIELFAVQRDGGAVSLHELGQQLFKWICIQKGITDREVITLSGGKPVFARENGLHFNMSHSGDWVVCAFSEQPIGVDAQKITRERTRISDRFYSAAEKEEINAASDRDAAFIRIWTRHESYGKMTGKGIHSGDDFGTACFKEWELAPNMIVMTCREEESEQDSLEIVPFRAVAAIR